MRILHILSQTELTGSEVYAAQLGRDQVARGHEVFYVSDKLHVEVPGPLTRQPISKRSWPQRIRNIRFLRAYLEENKIDIVHAHSRASSWICHWATRGLRTGYVSTVHGRQHLHRSLKAYSVYGDRVIAVCENVREHLVKEAGIPAEIVKHVPNGLSFEVWGPRIEASRPRLTLLGRTTGPKGMRAAELITQFLPGLLESFPELEFGMAGGCLKRLPEPAQAELEKLKAKYPGRVLPEEYMPEAEIADRARRSTLVVGSGRLAIGALASGVPTLALGEAACHGLVNEANLSAAMASNFGDMLAGESHEVDLPLLGRTIHNFLQEAKNPEPALSEKVRVHYALRPMSEKVEGIYQEALAQRRLPKRIPILMYHKVVKEGFSSPHKTYISEEAFAGHMRTLKRLGFATVTFQDLDRAVATGIALPKKPVVLTFDDGYQGTHRRALPWMKKYGHRGVFYLLGDREIRNNSWDPLDEEAALIGNDQLAELCAAGMEVGAHSMSHRHMSKLSRAEALAEAKDSKAVLEKLTGQRMVSYAYPYGDIDEQSKEVVREAGYSFAVATDSGGLQFSSDLFHLFRVNIFPQDGAAALWKKTLRSYRPYYAWKRGK